MAIEYGAFEHPYFYFFILSIIASFTLSYITFKKSSSKKMYNRYFVLFAISNGFWSVAQLIEILLAPSYIHILTQILSTFSASVMLWAWFTFICYYTDFYNPRKIAWTTAIPTTILMCITISTYIFSHETYFETLYSKDISMYITSPELNVYLQILVLGFFLYSIVSFIIMLFYSRKQGKENRKQYYLIILGQVVLIFGATISFIQFHPYPNIELVSAFFTIFGLIMWKAIYRYGFFDILPVARTKVVENLSQPIIVIDDRNRIIDKNMKAEQLTDYYDGNIQNENIINVFKSFEHSVDSFKKETQIENFTIKTKNDDDKYYIVTITPLFNNSNIYSGATISFEDITKLKEQQILLEERQEELEMQKFDLQQKTTELERQNNQLEQFASVLSHDIKNPLNMAQGYASLIKENPDDETYHENLDTGLTRIDEIIDSLLELTQQGKTVTETTETDVKTICEDSWGMLKLTNASLNVVSTMTFNSDQKRMQNVFENLFKNSQDHSPEGTQTRIEVGVLSDSNGFYIEDNGPGIPVEKQDDVFEYGVTHSEDGTGLGLSIVKQVVNAHGWEVAIKDAQNLTGVRFEVTGIYN